MKFLFLFLICNILSSNTVVIAHQNAEEVMFQDNQIVIRHKAEQLIKAFQELSSSRFTVKSQQNYFEAFPNNFVLFNMLFGYSDKEPFGEPTTEFERLLYKEAESFIPTFFKLNGIDKTQYYNRIIDISINGRWYADGVNYFQHGMVEKVNGDLNLFCKLLSKRGKKEIISFWYFYFDGPHPIKQIPKELQNVKRNNPKLFYLIELALIQVNQTWKEN
jgi:hypothetical protein